MGSWVKPPKNPGWGFEISRPNLHKISIEISSTPSQTRPNALLPVPLSVSSSAGSGAFAAALEEKRLETNRKIAETPDDELPDFFKKKNWQSIRGENIKPFAGEIYPSDNSYFGGPIVDTFVLKWRPALFTRASGEVVGALESGIPIPPNLPRLIRSIAVMMGSHGSQSGVFVGPRLLMSALHIHPWISGSPSIEECTLLKNSRNAFLVETEISSCLLSEHSPKLELVEFSVANDIGIFRLRDEYPPVSDWVDIEWLLQQSELSSSMSASQARGCKLACIGYSGKVTDAMAVKIIQKSTHQLRGKFSINDSELYQMDSVLKPELRAFAYGTLDKVMSDQTRAVLGVSCSLWKGSSGGPCVLLDGPHAGAIVGLVRGYEQLSDPYNLVNALPDGLKDELKRFVAAESQPEAAQQQAA